MARVVFFGSPDFSVPSLEALVPTRFRPLLVVTQPDRPAGRGRKARPTPVREAADRQNIPVTVIESLRNREAMDKVISLQPDFFVVVAFGLILPPPVLEASGKGNINLHASLLPAYRGASPINHAIAGGDAFTGVTTMEMVESLDSGPIYLQRVLAIGPMENAGRLSSRLAETGAKILLETLKRLESGLLEAVEQPKEGVTLAPRLRKEDGAVPWDKDAVCVHNHIRGMNPWPGSYTHYRGDYLKIHEAEPYDLVPAGQDPGRVLSAGAKGILVACGRGTVRLKRLQAAGKRTHEAGEFLRGFPLEVGEMLGEGSRT